MLALAPQAFVDVTCVCVCSEKKNPSAKNPWCIKAFNESLLKHSPVYAVNKKSQHALLISCCSSIVLCGNVKHRKRKKDIEWLFQDI